MKDCCINYDSTIGNEKINKLDKLFTKLFNAYVKSFGRALYDDTVKCDNSSSIHDKFRMFYK